MLPKSPWWVWYLYADEPTIRQDLRDQASVIVINNRLRNPTEERKSMNVTINPSFRQTATISLTCTNASFYTVGLDMGIHAEGTGSSARRMTNGGNVLAYGLYHNPAARAGCGLDEGNTATGKGTGARQTLTVFGRIFPDQVAVVGIYSDTVVVGGVSKSCWREGLKRVAA